MTVTDDDIRRMAAGIGVTITSDEDIVALRRRLAAYAAEPFTGWKPVPRGDQGPFVRAATARDASGVYVLRGGNRSGKTDCGAYVMAYRARIVRDRLARERAAIGKSTTMWAVGTTYEHCGNTMWKEKLRPLIPPRLIDGITWINRRAEHPKMVRLKSGLDIVFKSADQGRESMQAAGLTDIWTDEQVPQDLLSELFMRCIDFNAPFWWTFTPLNPDPVLETAINDPPKNWRFYQIDMEDNRQSRGGHLPDEKVDLELARLKQQFPDEYETRKAGHLMAAQGLIYKTFRRNTHVIDGAAMRGLIEARRDDFEFIGCGVDFGSTVPTCVLWGARDGNGRWFIFAEHYRAEWTIERHETEIRRVNREWSVSPAWFACDPGDRTGSNLGQEVTVSGRKYLRKQGHRVVNAVKAWSEGVRTVQGLLAREITVGKDGEHDYGEPRIYISDECPNLIRELGTYSRATETAFTDRDGPLKKNDHAPDALRYLTHTKETKYSGDGGGTGPAGGDRFARKFVPGEVGT